MGRFLVWLSHREPESPQLTGFWGLFVSNGISAQISATGMTPVPTSDRPTAYRALIAQLAHALVETEDDPIIVSEGHDTQPGITDYQGKWPLRVIPAKASTARVSANGVEMTVYASAHGKPPASFQIQVPMTPDKAQRLASDLSLAATEAKRIGR